MKVTIQGCRGVKVKSDVGLEKKKKLWFFVLDLKSNSLKHSLALSFRTGLERWRLMHWIEET